MTDTPDTPTEPTVQTLDDLDGDPHARVFDRPKTVRLRLDAGESMPEHDHPGSDIVVHVVEGRTTLYLDGDPYELVAGDLARFAGERRIEPVAETPTVAVVHFAPRAGDR